MAVVAAIGSTQVLHCKEVFQVLISLHSLHLLLLPVTDLHLGRRYIRMYVFPKRSRHR